ncbi:uncharacterized protein LOC114324311 [Diabrotica virgifera virgifera]|uniref:Uncharacterized protein n=1 Tax=Diabrotica virgifera virgifera TaxID=50390 RepID=A0ABM5I9D0_DIAVI|nr:uncharacterized protein LOC114324311 [Diabrotica virgifera virgifera]
MFVLETIKTKPMDHRPKVTLYSKKQYSPGIKVTDWYNIYNAQPVDRNPYCPKHNLFTSHYVNLGNDYSTKWVTTTRNMLDQVYTRRRELEINPNKQLVNVYTTIDIPEQKPKPLNYEDCYVSTMHSSYTTPYEYPIKRLTMTDPPFLQNRKFSHSPKCKFLDDTFLKETKDLQLHKINRHVSYNCNTNMYTDGSSGYVRENKCYDLNFYENDKSC